MKLDTALQHFKSMQAMADALGLRITTVSDWREKGVPPLRQLQLQHVTGGKLRADPDVFAPASQKKREPSNV